MVCAGEYNCLFLGKRRQGNLLGEFRVVDAWQDLDVDFSSEWCLHADMPMLHKLKVEAPCSMDDLLGD